MNTAKVKKKKKRSQASETWKRLRKNRLAVIGLVILAMIFLLAVFADRNAPHPYDEP